MYLLKNRLMLLRPVVTAGALIALLVSCLMPTIAPCSVEDQAYIDKFTEVAILRSNGEYDRAIELVKSIIKEYANSDNVLRYAYNQLVFTLDKKNDTDAKVAYAREALEKFPDLRIEGAEINSVPVYLNDLYDQLRSEMFGSVTVQQPEGCRMFLNGEFKGLTPATLPLVRVGEYEMVLTKSGYHDLTKRITVDPSGRHVFSESLSRERGTMWWVRRLSPALVGGAIITYGLVRDRGGNEPVADQPLPYPPNPPTQ
jgi:hypothetical protein